MAEAKQYNDFDEVTEYGASDTILINTDPLGNNELNRIKISNVMNNIDIVQIANAGIADNDTDTLTFDFVPSKIVLNFSSRAITSADDSHGLTTGQCVIVVTGTDAITSNMNYMPIYWDARTAVKYPLSTPGINDTSNVVYGRAGNNAGGTPGFFVGTAAWKTATKTLTITYQETGTIAASNHIQIVATAYR